MLSSTDVLDRKHEPGGAASEQELQLHWQGLHTEQVGGASASQTTSQCTLFDWVSSLLEILQKSDQAEERSWYMSMTLAIKHVQAC